MKWGICIGILGLGYACLAKPHAPILNPKVANQGELDLRTVMTDFVVIGIVYMAV